MIADRGPVVRTHGNSYEIFIFVLTLLSLLVMVLLVLPLSPATHQVLLVYDNLICCIFLVDFVFNLTGSHPRREYLIRQRGWLDLLGSIPALGLFQYAAILRLARISRLARIFRMLRGQKRKALIEDVLHNRSQYAAFITVLLAVMVLTVASVAVLQFESRASGANITTGGDALWWAIVTITTVGYGDRFPVTALGRVTGVAVMVAGIGIIGALASIFASTLISPPSGTEAAPSEPPQPHPKIEHELAATRDELAQARAELAHLREEVAAVHRTLVGAPSPSGVETDEPG